MDFGVVGLDHHHHHHHHHHQHHNNHRGLGVASSTSSEVGLASNNVISSSSSDPEANQHHQRASLCGSEFSYVKQERSSLEEYWRSSKVAKTASGGSDGVDDDFSSSVCKGMMFQQRNNNDASLLRSNSNTSNSNNNNNTTTLSFLDNGSYNNSSHSQQHQMLSFSSASPTKSEAHSNAATLAYFPKALSAYTATRNTGYNNNNSSMMMSMMHNGGGGLMMRSGPFTASQWIELEHQALIYKYITANVPIPTNLLIPIRKAFDFPPSLLRPSTNPLGAAAGWGTAFQLGYANNADPEPGRCRRTDGKKWRCSRDAVADQKYCERHMNRGRHRSRKPVEGPVATSNNIPTNTNTAATAKAAQQSFDLTHSASSTRTFAKENAGAPREFGLVSSVDSLLLNQKPSLSSHLQNSLHQFMDSCPDRTQLSISIPNAAAAASAAAETSLSPLRLSNAAARQAQWIPIAWEGSSPGGPLGEVLNKPNNNNGVVSDHHSKSASSTSSALNLMPEGAWDGSPPLGSSPTGVLQKTAFGSMSNSSAGSSPARAHDGICVNIDLLPPAHLTSSSSLPAL